MEIEKVFKQLMPESRKEAINALKAVKRAAGKSKPEQVIRELSRLSNFPDRKKIRRIIPIILLVLGGLILVWGTLMWILPQYNIFPLEAIDTVLYITVIAGGVIFIIGLIWFIIQYLKRISTIREPLIDIIFYYIKGNSKKPLPAHIENSIYSISNLLTVYHDEMFFELLEEIKDSVNEVENEVIKKENDINKLR